MSITPVPEVTVTPVATFPTGHFLENLAVRSDGSVLISSLLHRELWLVPGPTPALDAPPILVHTFEHLVMGILEVEPEIFVVNLSDGYTTHFSQLVRVDLSGWMPGQPIEPEVIYTFDYRARALNGSTLLAPGVMLVADCFAGLIWRIDLGQGAHTARARVWLEHPSMRPDPDGEVAPPPQPGINGIHYGSKSGYVYYTTTAQKAFMRVAVDPHTFEPTTAPEFVAAIDLTDDFTLDEVGGFAYVTRHRGNTIDRVPLAPGHGSEVRHIAGEPFDARLVGPSSAAWGRGEGDDRRVLYVTIDGGRTAPPADGIVREAGLVRLELLPVQSDAPAPAYATVASQR